MEEDKRYDIMTADYFEYIFLASCYENGVSDTKVYSLFVERVISELTFEATPYQKTISDFHQYIVEKYKIEIPPTLIKEVVRQITGYGKDFFIKKDTLIFNRQPAELQNKYMEQQRRLNEDSQLVFHGFNSFLKNNRQEEINYGDFKKVLDIYFAQFIYKKQIEDTELSKLLIEWITLVYKNKQSKLMCALDKIIYSWLLYSYFYSVKRNRKRLSNKKIIFDTNLLVYLLGINGEERKYFVRYLLKQLKMNDCSVVINEFTLREINNLLDSKENLEILQYKKQNANIYSQVKYNADEYFKNLFKNTYNLKLEIIEKSILNNDTYKDLISQLKTFKNSHNNNTTWSSAEHDIRLILSVGLSKVSNIYQVEKIIATSDARLRDWYSNYMKREFSSDYINLLTLNDISLIFWIESDKCKDSNFLMNTWMSISDSISFFKNKSINSFRGMLQERYEQEKCPPENWRSVYLLIKENLPLDKDTEDVDDDDLLKVIDNLSIKEIFENDELKKEQNKAKGEISVLKTEQQTNLQNTQVVQVQSEKRADDFEIAELLIALVKKFFSWLLKK